MGICEAYDSRQSHQESIFPPETPCLPVLLSLSSGILERLAMFMKEK